MAKTHSLEALRDEYTLLFARMKLKPQRERDISAAGQRIIAAAAKNRYLSVAAATGVPWFVIGIIHNLEASLRFDCHLHNGDSLKSPTVHVPKNRPPGWVPGPDQSQNWIASAIDAIKFEKLDQQHDWSVAGIAFALENFNGFGYRNNHPHVKNPYLWSFSNIYIHGKYVADGVFDENAVSDQCGGMALLRYLIDTDASIKAVVAFNDSHAEESEEAASRPFPGAAGPEGTPTAQPNMAPPKYPGRYLLVGIEQDADVKLLQQRLNFLGFDTKGIDSDFGQDTEDAVKLFQLRSADPVGEPLDVDGVVGPQTWEALFGRQSIPPRDEPLVNRQSALAAKVVEMAMSQLGVLEVPLGSNRGPQVDQYIASVDPGLVTQRTRGACVSSTGASKKRSRNLAHRFLRSRALASAMRGAKLLHAPSRTCGWRHCQPVKLCATRQRLGQGWCSSSRGLGVVIPAL
jgi:lysozyme family protein